MEEKNFRMFLAIVITALLVAIGWAIWDHHHHERHDFHIDVPGVRIDWDDDHPHHRRR